VVRLRPLETDLVCDPGSRSAAHPCFFAASVAMHRAVRVYLVRHGETEWSLSGRHTGRTDIRLTPHGEDEARALGQQLRGVRFARVLASPLQRARRTAELAGLNLPAEVEPDLAEWDYGDHEGRTPAEIRGTHPTWGIFRDGAPNGETPAQMSRRVDRVIARLRELGGDIAVFTHGHVGRALAVRWIGLALAEARHFSLATASLSVLTHDPRHDATPVIALWNRARSI